MQACATADEVRDAFDAGRRAGRSRTSAPTGVFLERLVRPARHVEVQVFGDGEGRVAVIGDRDCSLQRRNQKVVEEAPAPALPEHVRDLLHDSARELAASVRYRSAGTVEFVYDPLRQEASFLEVNTRLQVEHPVTEEVLRRRPGRADAAPGPRRRGRPARRASSTRRGSRTAYAVEARVYAEDPAKDSLPSSGLVTRAVFPEQMLDDGVRVDGWIETGSEVSPHYDPMLAKVIAADATATTRSTCSATRSPAPAIDGIVTNLGLLRALHRPPTTARRHALDLDPRPDHRPRSARRRPRPGHADDGAGPARAGSATGRSASRRAVRSTRSRSPRRTSPSATPRAPGLEITADRPDAAVLATPSAVVCVDRCTRAGHRRRRSRARSGSRSTLPAGGTLTLGDAAGPGLRTYLAVRGGFDVPAYLGSAVDVHARRVRRPRRPRAASAATCCACTARTPRDAG